MTEKCNSTLMYAPEYPTGSSTTMMKIGGTTFEIHTHWNPDGRQTILEQLMKLILNADMKQIAEDPEQVA